MFFFYLFFILLGHVKAQNEDPKSIIRLSLSDHVVVVALMFKCLNFQMNIDVICLFAMYTKTNIIIINLKLQ